MILFPNAKVNLGLHVLRRRSDGYHDIETLMVPVPELCDILELTRSERFEMHLYNAELPGENLCEKAWRLMAREFAIPPVRIDLYKKIPSGAGLGGGSADASFTLRGLNELFSLGLTGEELAGLSAELGSDCPFFVYNRPMMARGRGEVLTPFDISIAPLHIKVVPQSLFVSTREAYAGIVPREREQSLEQVLQQPVERWKDLLVNDFETTVFARYPQLAQEKQRLYDEGAVYAAMSGSGSSLFAIE